MIGYPPDKLAEEVAYIGYHMHWPYDQVMNMQHQERWMWVDEVARINRRLNEDAEEKSGWR